MSISRSVFTDTIKSINADLERYGELQGGKRSKISRSFLSGDSFRNRRERAVFINLIKNINLLTRNSEENFSLYNSGVANNVLYSHNTEVITTEIEHLKAALGGGANLRADLQLVIAKMDDELRLRELYLNFAREARNENLHLNELIYNPILIKESPVLNFTTERLNKLKELENKYYKDSPIDFAQLERMVTLNENLVKQVEEHLEHRWGLRKEIEGIIREREAEGQKNSQAKKLLGEMNNRLDQENKTKPAFGYNTLSHSEAWKEKPQTGNKTRKAELYQSIR